MIKTSMQAAVYAGPEQIRLSQQVVRLPGEGEILIQVAACGVCGTDIHIYHGEKGSADSPAGTILGHEFAGTVAAVGAGVTGLQVGDRVAVDPNDTCGACEPCLNGQAHFCENMLGIGTTAHGGFAEYCTFRAKQAWKLPPDLPFSIAAMAEPLACCLHGMDLAGIKSGQNVLIIGGGTIGLIMLQLAKLNGAAKVALVEPVEVKRKRAALLGADLCLDPAVDMISDCLQQAGLSRIHLTVECAGLGTTVKQAIDWVSRGGKVLLFGLTSPDCEVSIRPFDLFERELTIHGSFINPYTMGRAVSLLSSGRIRMDPLISSQVKLDDIEVVFRDESLRRQGKIIVTP